ncbi:Nuclear pore complex protein Nup98-Nup96 [Papilio xuthus]|uniref:Nuclear pore complex protein Nup98-Nup96 n=2 Tax=Papilio xuthus TaxID=66420 RepID=A0A194Q4W3_PAPXU|nr:Nuclear pore complex protein Nup98-Nup96 [Papilio xuthus]
MVRIEGHYTSPMRGSEATLSTSTTPSFGSFKPTTGTNAFGAPPAFGATATPQPATGGGLFGSTNTTGGLFGSSPASTSTPAFGATSSAFGFGANTSTGGLFSNNQSTGLFGNTQNNSAFGAKPAGFGFGNTSATGTTGTGLFGSTPSTSTGLFGQQNTTLGGGGLFNNTASAFGQQQAPTGTGHVKYNPVVGTDMVVKSGTSQNVNIKHHCITSFGQPATTSAPLFGGGSLGSTGFGQTNTFAFGGNTQNQTTSTGLFGNKPAFGATSTTGTGIFGASTTQAPTFGTTTPSFGAFGATTQNQQQSTGLFGKPATTGFGSTPASTGFGGFGGGLFTAKPQQTTAPTFGTSAPSAFGNLSTGFGTNTSSAGFFSNFGKPNTTPMLGGQTQNTGFGLGGGLGTSFQAKPAAAPAFSNLGTGSLFAQPQQNNTFRTGLDSGLGNSMFGTTPSLGTGLSLGGFNANTTPALGGGSAAGSGVHEQILTLAARPYGDSPLFKDLLPDSGASAEEALKPTNPAALKAALDTAYKVASPTSGRLRVIPRPTIPHDKKSLFDGLEESDPSLEDKLSLKPSRKRLVLRPNATRNDASNAENTIDSINRSLEETSRAETMVAESAARDAHDGPPSTSEQRNEINSTEMNAEKHTNWLSGSKVSWAEKEKPADGAETPRLYPNLDKDMPEVSERRASWLTTKPLRKPLASNSEAAENSVRELAVRPQRSLDKENVDSSSVSEEENLIEQEAPTHPAGIKLQRPGYYTIPSLEDLKDYIRPDGSCVVPNFTIGRKNYGKVFYDCEMDVANLDLDTLVHFLNKEVIIYPEDEDKPPIGQALNRKAVVTLDRVWPRDKTQRRLIVDPDRLIKMDYEGKLRRVCEKHETKFIEYRPQTGSWVFQVEHFSKYGLTDSDEEDEPTPDVLKRQLVNQTLQKTAAAAPKQPVAVQPAGLGGLGGVGGLGGLGGVGGLGGLGGVGSLGGLGGVGSPLGLGGLSTLPGTSSQEDMFLQRSSLDLLNGTEKAFEMDTTEDCTEVPSLYTDSLAFGVKSPTSELAKLEHRGSHNVQLMKASLYADIGDIDDDMSQTTEDQLVPLGGGLVMSLPSITQQPSRDELPIISQPTVATEEAIMRPLIVRPQSIVLKFHRKIPPFKKTIAGRLGASCLADLSVSRARHSRVGFGPRNTLAYVTTYDAMSNLPKCRLGASCLADLSVSRARHSRVGFGPRNTLAYVTTYDAMSNLPKLTEWTELGNYVVGRSDNDWSESVVTRLAIGRDSSYTEEALPRQMESLLELSRAVDVEEGGCPRLELSTQPETRRRLLAKFLEHAKCEVSNTYRLQVWKLCDALWGADLDNGGVPGTDVSSIVHRYKQFLNWLQDAANDVTQQELKMPVSPDPLDVNDGHSARVWTLLVGGRVAEACQLARKHGDLHMAMILAQASGDPSFRSLIAKQLQLWRECGATQVITHYRHAILELLAGIRPRVNDGHSARVWTLLVGGRVAEACQLARKHGDLHMAMILAQASGDPSFRSLIAKQLQLWRECGATQVITHYRHAILELLAGIRPRGELEKLDWIRALHVTAKYLCPQVPHLEQVIRTYEGYFSNSDEEVDLGSLEVDEMGMAVPQPPYTDEYEFSFDVNSSRRPLDVRYELVRARALSRRPRLQPHNYTADTMDYSLSFLLGSWLGHPTMDSIKGVAEQLEARGYWQLAIQALAYLQNTTMRSHLIRGVLSRNAPIRRRDEEPELSLLEKMRIPKEWILLAQADRAKYEHQPKLEVEYLVGARQWNAAHRVLVDQILADCVLSDNIQSIRSLLIKMSEAAQRHEINGWECGGKALYHYMHVCDEVRGLVSAAEGRAPGGAALQTRLEALRPTLAAACLSLEKLTPKNGRQAAARAEMGGRLVQLALAGGQPPRHLAALLRALHLPPDCTVQAQYKITTDLAEQASELCIDSPISSQRSPTSARC